MESIWQKQVGTIENKRKYQWEELQKIHWDVIVVGAGLAGLLTAYYLQEAGKRVLVLEASTIASGQTRHTTAKVTCQHGLKYHQLIRDWGEKKARLYAQANQEAIERYEQLIQKEKIECNWRRVPAFLYTTQNEEVLRQEAMSAGRLGIDVYFTKKTELPFEVKGAVCFPNQAQFSPLLFVKHLANQLPICEHTKVTRIKGQTVITEKGSVEAEHIVLATHYPIQNVPGFYFMRQHQERSYVLALADAPEMKGMYYGIDTCGLSFRTAEGFLLLGGGANRTGQNEKGGVYEMLRTRARQLFPACREVAHWSAQDCMPHDGIPMIGSYSVFSPRLYVATGFQKWGMTTSMVAAILLRDQLCGNYNRYTKLFAPFRMNFWASIGNLVYDLGVSVKGLSKGLLHRPKLQAEYLQRGQGAVVQVNGQRTACYRDKEGRLHMISARCAHLGCELTWNADEKSWDCPCHGSRYDIDGNIIDNPTKKDVRRLHW